MMRKYSVAAICLALFLHAPALADESAEKSGAWNYDFVLYGWLAGLEGTIGIAGVGDVPVDASFDELTEYLDFAIAGHFEAKNRQSLFVADLDYTNLGSERDAEILNQPVTIDMDLQQWIIEAGGGYRATPEIDLLLVGRYYVLDLGADVTSAYGSGSSDVGEDWGDIFVGARFTKVLKEKWLFTVRGDIGAGGSEFAWFGNIAAGYLFTDLISARVAWRVLSVDREGDAASADYFTYDITQSGVGIGVGFNF